MSVKTMANEFEVRVTRLQAQNLTMDVLSSSDNASFLTRAIGQGIWSLAEIDGGIDKLNRFLASEGYTLVKGDAPVKKAKAFKPAKARKASLVEDGDADHIPASRPVKPSSKWPEAKTSGEAIKALIAAHNITDQRLMDEYEFDEDEIKLLKDGEYEQIGRRILYELHRDMRKMLFAPTYSHRPGQMQRSQIVNELKHLFTEHTWLTKEELINNFEFGEDEYDQIMANDPMKFGVVELRMYLTDIRGAIAERAIQLPTSKVEA